MAGINSKAVGLTLAFARPVYRQLTEPVHLQPQLEVGFILGLVALMVQSLSSFKYMISTNEAASHLIEQACRHPESRLLAATTWQPITCNMSVYMNAGFIVDMCSCCQAGAEAALQCKWA